MSSKNSAPKEPPAQDSRPKQLDLNTVEMVFGTPNAPKQAPPIPDTKISITDETKPATEKPKQSQRDGETVPAQPEPLTEPDRGGPKPPLAGSETDALDGDHPLDTTHINNNGKESFDNDANDLPHKDGDTRGEFPELGGQDEGNWLIPTHGDEPDYPYDMNGLGSRFGEDRPISPMLAGTIPDVNTYQQKKNLAQGMMDLALLSANANQLRYVLESSQNHPYFYPSLVFISFSIILQVAVGVGLIMNSRYDVKDDKDICKADKINNMTVLGIFLITIVNVFVTSFSVATPAALTTVQNSG